MSSETWEFQGGIGVCGGLLDLDNGMGNRIKMVKIMLSNPCWNWSKGGHTGLWKRANGESPEAKSLNLEVDNFV